MRQGIGKKLRRIVALLLLRPHRPFANYLGAVGFNLLIVGATLAILLGWALLGSLLPLPEWLLVPFWLAGIGGAAGLLGIVLKY